MKALLAKLNLQPVNPGVATATDAWVDSTAAPITSYNPTTGEPIAQVIPADRAAYDAWSPRRSMPSSSGAACQRPSAAR